MIYAVQRSLIYGYLYILYQDNFLYELINNVFLNPVKCINNVLIQQ